ncbi:MAG: tetratricopeptide repeat protein [Methylophilaceae bacterium]
MKKNLIKTAQTQEKNGDLKGAIKSYQAALNKDPENIIIAIEIGNLYATLKQYNQAVDCFRSAHNTLKENNEIKRALCFCLNEIGNQYYKLRQFDQAEAAFKEILQYDLSNSSYLFNYGNVLFSQNKLNDALLVYKKAQLIKHDDADLLNNLGNTYQRLSKPTEAIECYQQALKINPQQLHTFIQLIHQKQNICKWESLDEDFKRIQSIIKGNIHGKISPFTLFSIPTISNQEHLKVANEWIKSSKIHLNPIFVNNKENKKTTIGYLSSDFRLHPLYYLVRDIFKFHDRNKFQIKLFYSGPPEETKESEEFKSIGDAYFNISRQSDAEAAQLMHEENIDLMVDLTGFTQNSRSLIAALRPAKFHINWLGYPGSMGFIDKKPLFEYLLADSYIIPDKSKEDYAEKILYLPDCYQPNIEYRPELKKNSRQEFGLKEDVFVFASFGQSIKITQTIFRLWMQLLTQVPNSILWLLSSNKECEKNLIAYAVSLGIAGDRLLFAKKISFDQHMQRHQVIDLFLDTNPYNAHTSTSDALWAGCPVLTLSGETFASRVAGSLLTTIGCEELITNTYDDYLKQAIYLANNRQDLNKIKNKIMRNRITSSLFDAKKFTSNLEGIYESILSR